MKKILIVVVFLAALILLSEGGFVIATLFTGGSYSVNTDVMPDSEYNLSPLNAYIKIFVESEQSVSVRFDSPSDAEKLVSVLNAETLSVEKFDSFTVTNYHSPLLRRAKNLNGQRVNLQIAIASNGTVTAGTPLLTGSY